MLVSDEDFDMLMNEGGDFLVGIWVEVVLGLMVECLEVRREGVELVEGMMGWG